MNAVAILRERMLLPNGEFRPGSVSRVAELLGCARTTVVNCIRGSKDGVVWTFAAKHLPEIQKIIKDEIPLCAKKRGPKIVNNSCA